jgi:replicative DNA helicase
MSKKFSPYILKSVLVLLLREDDFREKYFPILSPEHFNHEDKMVATLAKAIWLLADKYGKFPSLETIAEEVFKQKGSNIGLHYSSPSKEELSALKTFFLDLLEEEVSDRKYVEDNLIKILTLLSIQKVILSHKEDFASGELDYDEFAKEISVASTIATPMDLGVNLYKDLDKRTDIRNNSDITPGLVELNIPHFKHYLEEGGLPPGSLAFFLAPTNGGKSSALIHIAHDAAMTGHNVLYVTAELSEDMIKRRFDACMTGVAIHDIKKQAGSVRGKIVSSPRFIATAGRIHIVEVPMGTCRPSDIDILMQKLQKNNFNTNLLVVDYADNLRPERKFDAYRLEVSQIYKDLRSLAQKHKIVCWTASQMNDSGSEAAEKKNGVLTIRHVNESRGKIHLADLCIGIARTQEEKDSNIARLVLLKNRLGSGDGACVQVTTRFDISRIFGDEKNIVKMSTINPDEEISGLEGLSTPDLGGEPDKVLTPASLKKYFSEDESF